MILIGWMMRAIILGAKMDECLACHVPGPHLILRKTNWFTVFRIPVVFLWMSHGLLCTECGDLQPLGFLQVRKALKEGRMPLGRNRPRYEKAVRELAGDTDPADWEAFGVPPASSPEVIKARWHELAKTLHPDHGGDPASFVRMQAAYHRLSDAPEMQVGSVPDPKDLFDPVIKNPKRGFFDFYLKAWPVLAALVLVGAALQPHPVAGTPTGGETVPQVAPVVLGGTSHICWKTNNELTGCRDDDGSLTMLFGSQFGTQVMCVFKEPLLEGQSASCRTY